MSHRRSGPLPAAVLSTLLAVAFAGPERAAHAQDGPLKPYIVFVMDVSGSMDSATGFGPPSCGGEDTRFDHAKCAIANITSSYGEMVLALGRYRQSSTDTSCADGCTIDGIDCGACNEGTGAGCTADMRSADRFQLLVPLRDENQADILEWVDYTCGTCTTDLAAGPELLTAGYTPIAGSLTGARRYFQGGDPDWVPPAAGADPIRDDPLKEVFVGGAQCRPYIVVQLTDGDETCAQFSYTTAAAAALLTTDVDGRTYRVETKPIGFGQTPCDTQIEGIAHAGGAPDDGNASTCEGYYAQNEVDLSLALVDIISGSLKYEVCNEEDDDCDLLVDEDFPLKGTVCHDGQPGVCRDEGTYICNAAGDGIECVIPGPRIEPGDLEEVCNGLDDDCDGEVDEEIDCSGCIGVELCDGRDNDCDGAIDEGVARRCGSDLGVCEAGVEICVELTEEAAAGTWGPCSATSPDPPERCNGLDDDCDGVTDGLVEECTDLPDPPGNPRVGVCHPGTRVCPTNGSLWGPCLGEVAPADSDPCDGLDNDCDTAIDEDFTPVDCSSACGEGATQCVDGAIVCVGSTTPEAETCNGVDDDCDGLVDDAPLGDAPADPACTEGGLCVPGTWTCLAGAWACVGGQGPGVEICDCRDNDCDDAIDEGDVCAPGASCVACQCAYPCQPGEFPCPVGLACVEGFCLVDLCFGVTCQPDEHGDRTECLDGVCVRSCDRLECPPGTVCRGADGRCVTDDCHTFPERCGEGQLCVAGACVADPCAGMSCPAEGEYCLGGECVRSCGGVPCEPLERCVLGACEPLPCEGRRCDPGLACDEASGACVPDPCAGRTCGGNQVCDRRTGGCVTAPCLGVSCPREGEICVEGSCYRRDQVYPPDAGPPREYIAAAGGGGCSGCAVGPVGGGRPGAFPAAGALLLLLLTRVRAAARGGRR